MIGISIAFMSLLSFTLAEESLVGVDPNTLSCDPAGQVFLLLPHFSDCNKFYMCAHGQEVLFNCSGSTIFDFVQQTCAHPWQGKCILRTPLEDDDTEGSGEGSVEWFPDGERSANHADTIKEFGTSMLNCLRADTATKHLPYKGDCQRYWRCLDGSPKAAICSDGLFFNPQTQQCDYEANVKCIDIQTDELKDEFIIYKS